MKQALLRMIKWLKEYKGFWRIDHFICTAFVFSFMYIIYLIPSKFIGALTPAVEALQDFELTDIIFSQDLRETASTDTNLVLINTGEFEKYYVIEKIEELSLSHPKLILIDIPINLTNPSEDDLTLLKLAQKYNNIILSVEIPDFEYEKKQYHVKKLPPMFIDLIKKKRIGFNNYTPRPAKQTVRSFIPEINLNGLNLFHISVAATSIAAPDKAKRYIKRGNHEEYINFTGKMYSFFAFDIHKIFSHSQQADGFYNDEVVSFNFTDKIIICGYLGPTIASGDNYLNTKYFTPMNEKYAGKSYPDMFRIVVHANIITMILKDQPINSMPRWQSICIAIAICFVNVALFYYIHDNYPDWYDFYAKFIQLFETIGLLFLVITVFQYTNFKMDLVLAVNSVLLSSDLLEIYTGSVPNITRHLFKKFKLLTD